MSVQDMINKVWWSGFCAETVEFSATTVDDPDGATKRAKFVHAHIEECTDCAMAVLWKNAEGEIARRLGAFEFFEQGGDIFERYGDEAREQLEAVSSVELDASRRRPSEALRIAFGHVFGLHHVLAFAGT